GHGKDGRTLRGASGQTANEYVREFLSRPQRCSGIHVFNVPAGVPILGHSLEIRTPAMTAPVTLTFRHLPRSGALESAARDIGNRLHRLYQRMTACHIVLEGNAAAPEAGGPVHVRIHVSVPGAQIHAESAC